MENNILYIKNVVCHRCKMTVGEILARLEIPFRKVSLGEVILERPLDLIEILKIEQEFKKVGFEILADKDERIVNQIKSIIIENIYEENDHGNRNLSVILSEKLRMDYSHLSSLFSKLNGKSIQDFQKDIKIERIKELLGYEEKNISEIALDLGYGSAAYLSTQFKKATGLTPSQYKLQHSEGRHNIDSV